MNYTPNIDSNELFIALSITIICGYLYFKYKKTYSFWSSRKVKGPFPWPFFGNSLELFFNTYMDVDKRNYEKFGGIYGVYEGSTPILIISDPKLIQHIAVKEFNLYSNHVEVKSTDPIDMKQIISLGGNDWKRIRGVLTTGFTISKLKLMFDTMKVSIDPFLENLEIFSKNGGNLVFERAFELPLLNMVLKTLFSYETDIFKTPTSAIMFFQFNHFTRFLTDNLPQWLTTSFGVGVEDGGGNKEYSMNLMRHIIHERKKKKGSDYLQILLDSKVMDDVEVHSNSIFTVAAAYDTTIATLCFACYELAINNEIQEKVYEEVKYYKDLTFDTVNNFHYLEAVVMETLRKYPTDNRSFRRPVKDVVLEEIHIPAGLSIQFSHYAVHHSNEYYPEPEVFNPDRFLPENKNKLKPYTFLSFGSGPRMCIGMRYAILELKLILTEIVRNYRLIPSAKTLIKPEFPKGSVMIDGCGLGCLVFKR